MPTPIVIETVTSPMFDQNAYLVGIEGRDDAFVVDPGFNVDGLFRVLDSHGWRLTTILNTHGHLDHVVGNEGVKEQFPDAPIIVGIDDAPMLTDANLNLSAGYGLPLTSPPADRTVQHGDVLDLLDLPWRVAAIPGHSPGHVIFICEKTDPVTVMGGDVLFAGSIGRTDFPGGSHKTLLAGIREHIFSLPDNSIIYPGHGPTTTVGREKRMNPYLTAS